MLRRPWGPRGARSSMPGDATWPVLLVVVMAGCGGGTAAAPTVTAPEPSTATAAATTTAASTAPLTTGQAPVTTAKRPELTFPATTPTEVLALAAQRPTGVADYQVTITGTDAGTTTDGVATSTGVTGTDTTGTDTTGTGTTGTDATAAGVTYAVELASDDTRARIHQTQPDGQTWIGLDLGSNRVTYTCTEPTGQAPVCKSGDDDGSGARAALEISRVLGNSFVAQVFSPIAAQEHRRVRRRRQPGGRPGVVHGRRLRPAVREPVGVHDGDLDGGRERARAARHDRRHDGRSRPAAAAVTARSTTVVISRSASAAIAAS